MAFPEQPSQTQAIHKGVDSSQCSAFPELAVTSPRRVDSAGHDTITNGMANSKPIPKQQHGTLVEPGMKPEVTLFSITSTTPLLEQQRAEQAQLPSKPPHSSALPSPPKPRIIPAIPKLLEVRPSPKPRKEDGKKGEEESYEKLGSSALLEGSVPDFSSTGPNWRNSDRGVNTDAVCRFFNNAYQRRVNRANGIIGENRGERRSAPFCSVKK